MKRIGIIGGGLAGLSAAFRLQNNQNSMIIQIIQAESHLGGRVFEKNTSFNNQSYHFDMGANLIDFESKETLQTWHSQIPQSITQKLMEFKGDFLIFEKNKLRKADYYKQRFYYKGGFAQMIKDFESSLKNEKVKILKNTKISKIGRNTQFEKQSFMVQGKSQAVQFNTIYDVVIAACPPPIFYDLLDQEIKIQYNLLTQYNYTKQISIGFVASENMNFFSGILFKNHPSITFICSNQQKYGENSIVVQTTEQFTAKYYLIENDSIIISKIWEQLPEQFKSWVNPHFGVIKKWDISLLKPLNDHKQQSLSILSQGGIKIAGDAFHGKSRITNAISSGLMIDCL